MSHIVIHDDSNNVTHYARFDDVQAAAAYLEELHGSDGAIDARLFALDEVHFEVRSYVKVEIGEPTVAAAVSPVDPAPVFTDEADPTAYDDRDDLDEIETVEYVEAAMAPVDVYPPANDVGDEPSGEPRRGLFGR